MLNIIKNDPWLEPFAPAIEGRHNDAVRKEKELVKGNKTSKVLPTHTFISGFIATTRAGCSANGRPTQRPLPS